VSIVVITGGSSGFGLLAALEFARGGHGVYATMRDPSRAGDLLQATRAEDLAVRVVELNVTDDASVRAAITQVIEAEGRIDVLVNNAGIAPVGSVETMPDSLIRETFETNFFGSIRVVRSVLPAMRAQRSGTIVVVSSIAGRLPGFPADGYYGASKHALGAICEALAAECEPFGIHVAVIEPGYFKTKLAENSHRKLEPNSPYGHLEGNVQALLEQRTAAGANPSIVAQRIVALVGSAGARLHHIIGADAQASYRAYASMSESRWAALIRTELGER